ncbi:hypothetical protein RclHR1_01370007 [Rhizophagus clarus]|uniref:Uncharacterized protein n=1 Tax=Rhizophagus clarus TaxID=94130 RepID=A0A2Z6R379_9GLOM|nr:hypothetical protein RclHR1_01370007 [Rhizophagus clarus]
MTVPFASMDIFYIIFAFSVNYLNIKIIVLTYYGISLIFIYPAIIYYFDNEEKEEDIEDNKEEDEDEREDDKDLDEDEEKGNTNNKDEKRHLTHGYINYLMTFKREDERRKYKLRPTLFIWIACVILPFVIFLPILF